MTDLVDLLPHLYRRRDEEAEGVLRALLEVVDEQRALLSDSVDQLYDDWFVETCQEWLVPYLGELVGHRVLPGLDRALGAGQDDVGRAVRVLSARRDVADAVANRRRKGTLAILEELAADVAGLPARAVELRVLVAHHQPVRLFGTDPSEQRDRLARGRLVDVRHVDALDRVDGPFDELAHLVDVRRVDSHRRRGRPGTEQVELHGWRLGSIPLTRAPAYCTDRDRSRFTFSVLGNDAPLVTAPVREPGPTHVAEETNLPTFIRRLAMERSLADYYGPGKSMCLHVGDEVVPASRIVVADLTGWGYTPVRGTIAVDPVLGRLVLPSREAPDRGVWVSYRYASPADIGGGEYLRAPTTGPSYRCGPGQPHATIAAALAQWTADKQRSERAREATVELVGSGAFTEQLRVEVEPGDRLTIRAAPGSRPVVRLLDFYANRPDSLVVVALPGDEPEDGAPPPTVTLDGLLVTGRNLLVQGPLGTLRVLDCTLVPGWTLGPDCRCEHPGEPSIELDRTTACVEVSRSILGPVRVLADTARQEPVTILVADSVLDAQGAEHDAVLGEDGGHAHAELALRRTTVLGGARVWGVSTVEDSIVTGPLAVARRQQGCVRFTWVHPASRTPARFHCEPETSGDPVRVVPRFTSDRYGTPAYAQLDLRCAAEVVRGAEDGGEMGVHHDLYWPQRCDRLDERLDEFTPAGSDAGVHHVT